MGKGKVLSTILGVAVGAAGGAAVAGNACAKNTEKWKKMSDKHLALFLLMNEWMRTKQEGKSIKDYLDKYEYKTVAVYGMSYVGERLLDELQNCGIEVKYAIDQNADTIYTGIDVYSPEDDLPEVDVIIVTAVYFFDEIYDKLSDKVQCAIVSLEDVLYEI